MAAHGFGRRARRYGPDFSESIALVTVFCVPFVFRFVHTMLGTVGYALAGRVLLCPLPLCRCAFVRCVPAACESVLTAVQCLDILRYILPFNG